MAKKYIDADRLKAEIEELEGFMSKDYRCKDCEFWKEYGYWCTKLYTHAGDLAKKCKHFKLKK